MNRKLLIIRCPKCNYESNLETNNNSFKIYEGNFMEYPYIKCPKCDYKENVK